MISFLTNLIIFLFKLSGNYWNSANKDNIGKLWLKLLTFYSVDFVYKKTFVSVRRLKRISKSDFKMYTKKMSIEDPFYTNQSLSRHLSSQTNKFIITAINKTCLYFGQLTHQLSNVPSTNSCSTIKEKIVEKLIEETGINEARKFVCKNMNMEENEYDEEEEENEEDENGLDDELVNENEEEEVDYNDETISDDYGFDLDENEDVTEEVGEDEEFDDDAEIVNSKLDAINLNARSSTSQSDDDLVKTRNVKVTQTGQKSGSIENLVKNCVNDLLDNVIQNLFYDTVPSLNVNKSKLFLTSVNVISNSTINGSTSKTKTNYNFTANAIGLAQVTILKNRFIKY